MWNHKIYVLHKNTQSKILNKTEEKILMPHMCRINTLKIILVRLLRTTTENIYLVQ